MVEELQTQTNRKVMDAMCTVNRFEVDSMDKAGKRLDPSAQGSCEVFNKHVRDVQAVLIYNFKVIGQLAIQQEDPAAAAELWHNLKKLCEGAMNVLRAYKDVYPFCGTPALYDLALHFWSEANSRAEANSKDAEWKDQPIPEGLFPKRN